MKNVASHWDSSRLSISTKYEPRSSHFSYFLILKQNMKINVIQVLNSHLNLRNLYGSIYDIIFIIEANQIYIARNTLVYVKHLKRHWKQLLYVSKYCQHRFTVVIFTLASCQVILFSSYKYKWLLYAIQLPSVDQTKGLKFKFCY